MSFVARYSGWCHACRQDFPRGTRIDYDLLDKIVHAECPAARPPGALDLPDDPQLVFNDRQQRAYDAIAGGDNRRIYHLSGPAGTGKSEVVKQLMREISTLVLAPTGMAAVNVGGKTIHSALQVGFGVLDPLDDYAQVGSNFRDLSDRQRDRLRQHDLLVIDEISMVRSDLLDAIDRRLSEARGNEDPFGGMQVVLVGDSRQLPPVLTDRDKPFFNQIGRWPSPWWFHSEVIQRLGIEPLLLSQSMRQDDPEFVDVLNRCRKGRVRSVDLRYLNQRVVDGCPASVPTLYHANRNVDQINDQHLGTLDGPDIVFHRIVERCAGTRAWFNDHHPPEQVRLRLGALVMVTKNGEDCVNGDTGRVIDISDQQVTVQLNRTGAAVVFEAPHKAVDPLTGREEYVGAHWEQRGYLPDGKGKLKPVVEARAWQIPLRVAAALTIHKAQGATVDQVYIGRGFGLGSTPGLAYTALSRVRTVGGLYLEKPLTADDFRADSRVVSFNRELREIARRNR